MILRRYDAGGLIRYTIEKVFKVWNSKYSVMDHKHVIWRYITPFMFFALLDNQKPKLKMDQLHQMFASVERI